MDLFETVFQGICNKLTKRIDPDHGLWLELQSRGVLTREQIDNCNSCVWHYWLL